MEQKIRAMEEQMHHVEGAELEKLLEDYNRMHHQSALRRTKDQSCAWKTACYKAGHHPVR